MRNTNLKIPFSSRGLQHYPESYSDGFRWEDNYEFEKTLTVNRMTRGRSAAGFVLTDETGYEYPMFMKDMLEIILSRTIDHGRITGKWTFCKRGQNYGIRLIMEKHDGQ